MRHLMSPLDFTVDELYDLMKLADDIRANRQKYASWTTGRIKPQAIPCGVANLCGCPTGENMQVGQPV